MAHAKRTKGKKPTKARKPAIPRARAQKAPPPRPPMPPGLAEILVDRVGIRAGMRVLEPSAGEGAIALPLMRAGVTVVAVEFDPARAAKLQALAAGMPGLAVYAGDFLAMSPADLGTFDAVVMNPPFSLPGRPQADMDHVEHALRFVRPGGMVVAIVSRGADFRENRRAQEFRAMVEQFGGWSEELPEDAFRSSGTLVRTSLVTIPAPGKPVDESDKQRAARERVEHLAARARSRAVEARSLEPAQMSRREAGNAWADAVAAMVSKNLKRDVGAAVVRKQASGGQVHRHGFFIGYSDRHPDQSVRIQPGDIEIGRAWQLPDVRLEGERTIEEAYAAIVAALPKVGASEAAAVPVDPKVFESELIAYAKKRIKRDTGVTEVAAREGYAEHPSEIGLYARPRIGRATPKGEIDRWEIEVRGTNVRVIELTAVDDTHTRPTERLAFNAAGMPIADAYARILTALPRKGVAPPRENPRPARVLSGQAELFAERHALVRARRQR